MLVVLLTAHAAAVPRGQRVLAALEADLDALERMQTAQTDDCGPAGSLTCGIIQVMTSSTFLHITLLPQLHL